MSLASEAEAPASQRVDGKRRPGAWGHRFGSDLRCDWCTTTWDAHQEKPRPCAGARIFPLTTPEGTV
jgi:hypothetical protein